MPGAVRFYPTADDDVAALRVHHRGSFLGRRLWRWLGLVIVVTAVMAVLSGWNDGDPWAGVWTSLGGIARGVGALLAFASIGPLMLPRRGRRLYRQHRMLHQDHDFAWDDAGVHWHMAGGDARYGWTEYHEWRAGAAAMLIYLDDQLFHFVPLRLLDEGARADLGRTIAAHGPEPAR